MASIKIAFFEIEDWQAEYIQKNTCKEKSCEINVYKEALTRKNCIQARDCDAIAVFIYSRIDKAILDKLPKLRLIATMSTGFDHIDIKECEKRGISVCNVPFYGENTVAEHTFALMLALSRKIYTSIDRTRHGRFDLEGLRGFDLKGKTLGLIGTGHISAHVARIAYGFEMNIVGYDVFRNPALEKDYGLKYVELDTLLKSSDIVSLHLPLNDKTRHIINKKNIKLMKKGAMLINTARGGLIETAALVDALEKKIVGGAALDVLEEETSIKEETELLSSPFLKKYDLKTVVANHILLKFDNVLITPHNAFNSQEALQRIVDTTMDNIHAYATGKLQNAVQAAKTKKLIKGL